MSSAGSVWWSTVANYPCAVIKLEWAVIKSKLGSVKN